MVWISCHVRLQVVYNNAIPTTKYGNNGFFLNPTFCLFMKMFSILCPVLPEMLKFVIFYSCRKVIETKHQGDTKWKINGQ